ncbi:fas apoptotic inhibitory molecule 2b isoform X1 [Eleginops maclovinus]|uniref:fas apoptotic inhibitory molecule 2b isoform X1 n=1 Tax=Eleginops maclovinus TaxID=56733 RepID=UPI00307FF69E
MKKGKQVDEETEPPSYQEVTAGYNEMEAQFAWDDKTIRRTFIRKVLIYIRSDSRITFTVSWRLFLCFDMMRVFLQVYAILMVQLFVTVAIVSLFSFCAPVRYYIQTHPGLYMASYLVFFATYIALSCCGNLRRQFPWNIILLVLFTLSMASMMGFVSSFYNTKSVVLCLGITSLVCLSVTIFSFQTKIDVTSCHGVLFSLCMVMLLCAITLSIVVPFGYVPWLHALYAVGGAILFTLFLAFDTQLLLGNKRYTISPEEYVFATLSLYLDIIYLFSFLLQIFGGGRSETDF